MRSPQRPSLFQAKGALKMEKPAFGKSNYATRGRERYQPEQGLELVETNS